MGTKRSGGINAAVNEHEIDLRVVFQIMKRKLWLILLLTGLLTALGTMYNSRPEPQIYAASTRVIISATNDMMSTVRALVREPIVLDRVISELDLPMSASQLRGQIRVDSVEGSLITVVSVIHTNPELAARIANETVSAYRIVAADTLNVRGIRLLTEARPEPLPINTTSNTIVYVAFIAGLVLSVSLAFLLDSLDDSIRSERDIERRLGLNMLGQVSKISRRHSVQPTKKIKSTVSRGETIGS